jgi:hypothetical protein
LEYENIYLKGNAHGGKAKTETTLSVAFSNAGRPHHARGNRPTMAALHEDVTGALGAAAVNMALRFDNAGTLLTPQQPSEQRERCTAEDRGGNAPN